MPILFSAVAHNNNVISKYASCEGNFNEILDEVMSKIPSKDHKMTYSHGHYLLNYVKENKHFYFCITTKACQRSRAFLYLNEIKRRFKLGNKEFHHVLASEMQRYSEDYNTIVIRKGELDELNKIAVDSSESILGEKMLYVKNYDNLSFTNVCSLGGRSQRCSVDMQASTWRSSAKFYLAIGIVILILIWLAISTYGPVKFVIVTCVFILTFVKFTRLEKNS